MDPFQRAVFLQSQTISALIEMESMKVANEERRSQGYSLAYDEKAFIDVIARHGISHNQALITLRGE